MQTVKTDEKADLGIDGKSFVGKMKAGSVYRLVSVKGILSFQDGFLIWSA
jgi:hypothetical protein